MEKKYYKGKIWNHLGQFFGFYVFAWVWIGSAYYLINISYKDYTMVDNYIEVEAKFSDVILYSSDEVEYNYTYSIPYKDGKESVYYSNIESLDKESKLSKDLMQLFAFRVPGS